MYWSMRRDGMKGGDGGMDVRDVANFLMLVSAGANPGAGGRGVDGYTLPPPSGRVFECATCKRKFPSFQALGGHRASHKKPRLQLGREDGVPAQPKPKTHECHICGLEFGVGQALGGHMRRHRSVLADRFFVGAHVGKKNKAASTTTGRGGEKAMSGLDLNLPPVDNDAEFRLLASALALPVVVDSSS